MNFARLVDITTIDRLELQVSRDAGMNEQLDKLTWSISRNHVIQLTLVSSLVLLSLIITKSATSKNFLLPCCCLATWSEWTSQPTPGKCWLQFPRVIGEGQLGDPTPRGRPLWRTTYLCTTLPSKMLPKWLWISSCGDYCQQAELRTDGACRIMMMNDDVY